MFKLSIFKLSVFKLETFKPFFKDQQTRDGFIRRNDMSFFSQNCRSSSCQDHLALSGFCHFRAGFVIIILIGLFFTFPATAQTNADIVPRFASLRANEVNLRTGPGVRYPIIWKYLRQGLPVEITAEFEHWRRIRDWQGEEGWVHRSMLSGQRTLIITDQTRDLRHQPRADAPVIARLSPGVSGTINRCENMWCSIESSGHEGWLRRDEFWGIYFDETIE